MPQSSAGAASRQTMQAQRLDLDLPVEADDADLREGDARPEPHRHALVQ